MFWRKRVNREQLERLASEGGAIREMMSHYAGRIVEKRLSDELEWVRQEWLRQLESESTDIIDKHHELYAYLRALQLCEFILLDIPKAGWNAEDKLLAFADRERQYQYKQ